jgi:TRAP-type C4-dicarboxylate transport system permease small subunit
MIGRGLAFLEKMSLVATRALSALGLLALMVLAFFTLANGLLRGFANQPIAGVVDVAGLAIAIAVACCLPVAQAERGHIAFRVVTARIPRLGRTLDALAAALVLAVLVLMAHEFGRHTQGVAASRETTYVLKLAVAPFWRAVTVLIWIAAAVQAVVMLTELGRLFGYRPATGPEREGAPP